MQQAAYEALSAQCEALIEALDNERERNAALIQTNIALQHEIRVLRRETEMWQQMARTQTDNFSKLMSVLGSITLRFHKYRARIDAQHPGLDAQIIREVSDD